MDHERDARGVRRWGAIGAVGGGIAGLALGVAALLSGDEARMLWAGPAFASLMAGCAIGLRARVELSFSEIGRMNSRDRRRTVARHVVPTFGLMLVGGGFLVLTGVTEIG